MIKKNAVIHKLGLAVPVVIAKEDVKGKIKTREDGVQYLEEGTLLKAKSGNFRKQNNGAVLASNTDVEGILVHTVEFGYSDKTKIDAVMLEGIVYFDRLKKVDNSINEEQLPKGITYIYVNDK